MVANRFSCLAISGLGGHAFGSFKEKDGSYMWLCDDLPYHLATARIIIYGYKSQLHGSQSFQGLEALASNLRAFLRYITVVCPIYMFMSALVANIRLWKEKAIVLYCP
jgi:hypothetical protein